MASPELTASGQPAAKQLPWCTLWAPLLHFLLLWSVAVALARVLQGADAGLLLSSGALAFALAWTLARSPASGRQAAMLAGLVGLGWISFQVGQLTDEMLALAQAGLQVLRQLPFVPPLPSLVPIIHSITVLFEAYRVLLARFWTWSLAVLSGEPAFDPVASALTWSALFWGCALWSAWYVRRRSELLLAVLPIIALLGITYYSVGASFRAFLIPLGLILCLLAFVSHDQRQREWEAGGVGRPEGMLAPVAQAAVPLAVLLVFAAAWLPTLSTNTLIRFGQRLTGQRTGVAGSLTDSLGVIRSQVPGTGLTPLLAPGLPNRHLIGSGPELAERAVMTVTLADLPIEAPIPDYRWRALTYDRYTGQGWQTSSLYLLPLAAGDPVMRELSPAAQVVRQRVQSIGDLGGLAYATGQLAAIDQDLEMAWREIERDPFAGRLQVGDYWAESLVPNIGEAELRAAEGDYPDWVRDRYLSLPVDVPARVLALARNVTATVPTAYDRALALETFLRSFPYTLEVPAPPSERDVVEYFLFDLRQGYCDYYATSMAVLARAAGLPARLVVGYYTGEPERSEGTIRYLITEADAHSWVEVYFTGIGWVEFEPTAGRAAIERPAAAAAATVGQPPALTIANELRQERWKRLGAAVSTGAAMLLAALLAVGLGRIALDQWRLGRLAPAEAVGVLYLRLARSARRWGHLPEAGVTPQELLSLLAFPARDSPRLPTWASPAFDDVRRLILTHEQAAFTPRPIGQQDLRAARAAWLRIAFRRRLASIQRPELLRTFFGTS